MNFLNKILFLVIIILADFNCYCMSHSRSVSNIFCGANQNTLAVSYGTHSLRIYATINETLQEAIDSQAVLDVQKFLVKDDDLVNRPLQNGLLPLAYVINLLRRLLNCQNSPDWSVIKRYIDICLILVQTGSQVNAICAMPAANTSTSPTISPTEQTTISTSISQTQSSSSSSSSTSSISPSSSSSSTSTCTPTQSALEAIVDIFYANCSRITVEVLDKLLSLINELIAKDAIRTDITTSRITELNNFYSQYLTVALTPRHSTSTNSTSSSSRSGNNNINTSTRAPIAAAAAATVALSTSTSTRAS